MTNDSGSGDSLYSYRFSKFVVLAVAIMALVALLILLWFLRGGRFSGSGPQTLTTPATNAISEIEPSSIPLTEASPQPTTVPPSDTSQPTTVPPSDTPQPTTAPASDTPQPMTAPASYTPQPTTVPASNTPEQVAEVIPTATNTPQPPPTTAPPTATPLPPPTDAPTSEPPPTDTPVPATGQPTIVLVAPSTDGKVPPGRVDFSGTGPPGANIEVFVDGEAVASTTANETGQWVASVEQGPAPGDHEVQVEARDENDEAIVSSDTTTITVLEAIVPVTGSEDLPWPVMLLVASALASLALVFALGGKILRAFERYKSN